MATDRRFSRGVEPEPRAVRASTPVSGPIGDDQISHVYHGTEFSWRDKVPMASYDNPFHVATERLSSPAEKASGWR